MFCQKCGAEIDDSSSFCAKCGEFIDINQSLGDSRSDDSSGTLLRRIGRVLGVVLMLVGLVGLLILLFGKPGRYRGDWDNELFSILWATNRFLSLIVFALGAILLVLSCKKDTNI